MGGPRSGFAALSPEQRRAIARKGGRAVHALGRAHEWTHEEAKAAGRIGGRTAKGPKDRVQIRVPAGRGALVKALAQLPEEAWGYFVAWAAGAPVGYPDGLGGFRDDSREAIAALRSAAKAALERQG